MLTAFDRDGHPLHLRDGSPAFDIECIVDGRDEVAAEEEAAGGGGWGVVLIAHSTKLT